MCNRCKDRWPDFQRRHMCAIAAVFASLDRERMPIDAVIAFDAVVKSMAHTLDQGNSGFSYSRFYSACGYDDPDTLIA